MQVELDWGAHGARRLAATCQAVVVVDVLSFSTLVSVLVRRGCAVVPLGRDDQPDPAVPAAVARGEESPERPWSLSPARLLQAPLPQRLTLPSPNGSLLTTLLASSRLYTVVAGCPRNAAAVARWLAAAGVGRLGLLAAGEREPDGALRPALEDLLGAGAVAEHLQDAVLAPDAEAARAAWPALRPTLAAALLACPSGQELVAIGYAEDVRVAAQTDADDVVPLLVDGAYTPAPAPG